MVSLKIYLHPRNHFSSEICIAIAIIMTMYSTRFYESNDTFSYSYLFAIWKAIQIVYTRYPLLYSVFVLTIVYHKKCTTLDLQCTDKTPNCNKIQILPQWFEDYCKDYGRFMLRWSMPHKTKIRVCIIKRCFIPAHLAVKTCAIFLYTN